MSKNINGLGSVGFGFIGGREGCTFQFLLVTEEEHSNSSQRGSVTGYL